MKPIILNSSSVLELLANKEVRVFAPLKPCPLVIIKVVEDTAYVELVNMGPSVEIKCPYGNVGNTLWVRETIRAEELPTGLQGIRYRADNHFVQTKGEDAEERWEMLYAPNPGAWIPAIFAPRWTSRITLIVKDIKVEPTQWNGLYSWAWSVLCVI